jgi:hypothetical protein
MSITCEQCLAVYRKPLAELCQRGMRNLHLEVRHQSIGKGESDCGGEHRRFQASKEFPKRAASLSDPPETDKPTL